MPDVISSLTTKDAAELILRKKYFLGTGVFDFPLPGKRLKFEIFSYEPEHTSFCLDVSREAFNVSKHTFQHRVYTKIILLRLDLGVAGHRNPNGEEIRGAHLHVYNEDYGDRWAYPLPQCFTDVEDIYLTLEQFMDYCNIIRKPVINRVLF